jgi:hypothetical protein
MPAAGAKKLAALKREASDLFEQGADGTPEDRHASKADV